MVTSHLTNMKLDCDPKLCHTKDGKNRYYVFFASDVVPDRNGTYLKVSCQAWSHMADKIEIMKLHAGSVVNMLAYMSAYEKNGSLQYSFNVIDITFAEFLGGQDRNNSNQNNSNQNTKSNEPTKAKKSLLEQLAEAPFK